MHLFNLLGRLSRHPAVIQHYEKFSYFTLNQQSSWSIKGFKKFYAWSASVPKYKFFWKNMADYLE